MTVEAPIAPPPVVRSGHRHSRPRRRLPGWVTVILWIVTGGLAVVAAMRLVAWDALEPFAVLNSVTAFVYLPVWIVVIVAVAGKRYALAGAALVVVALQVAFMLPELTASESIPSWTKGAPTIRLLDANVYADNASMSGYADQIKATRPDLVTLEEANPNDVTQLTKAGALTGLPYTIEVKRYDPTAFFVASKYPLTGTNVVYRYGNPLIVQTTVQLPSGPQPLWVVHTVAPLPISFSRWKGQMDTLHQLVQQRGPKNLLIVGDFNSTWGNKGFRTLLAAGMTDGAAARGKPFDMTWSQIKHPLPPMVRIDHVVTGSGLAVTQIQSGPGPGSDHRDLSATIAIHRR
jgi:endonuclease/exonuclease/phosphatase (EEP) superfamily protein YafD